MKEVGVFLAILSFITGMIAAYYWHKSTKIRAQTTQPGAKNFDKAALGLAAGLLEAYKEASRLNAIAARWTAASVILSGLAAGAGALSN